MRHRVKHKNFGRQQGHRIALFRNLLTSLVKHERIVTTLPKAKELRSKADHLITIAKKGTLSAYRRCDDLLFEKKLTEKLWNEIAPRFRHRPGGYTRVVRLGNRQGDVAPMALIEYIDQNLEYPKEWKKPVYEWKVKPKRVYTRFGRYPIVSEAESKKPDAAEMRRIQLMRTAAKRAAASGKLAAKAAAKPPATKPVAAAPASTSASAAAAAAAAVSAAAVSIKPGVKSAGQSPKKHK